jgi:hypothetical protein
VDCLVSEVVGEKSLEQLEAGPTTPVRSKSRRRVPRALLPNPFVFMVVSLGAALFAPTVGHLSVFKPPCPNSIWKVS